MGERDGGGCLSAFDLSSSFNLTHFIQFSSDADDIHYDPRSETLFVSVGDTPTALLVEVNVHTGEVVGQVPMPAHVEGFDVADAVIYAATPNANSTIHRIDRDTRKIVQTLPMPQGYSSPFPLVYDRTNDVLLVGSRVPGALVVLDAKHGSMLYAAPTYLGADDLFLDTTQGSGGRTIYVSAGGNPTLKPPTIGGISVFVQRDRASYDAEGTTDTGEYAKTSLLDARNRRIFTAVPSFNVSAPAFIEVLETRE